jgi:CubicO group peptidase (beta-lactamase class C family)
MKRADWVLLAAAATLSMPPAFAAPPAGEFDSMLRRQVNVAGQPTRFGIAARMAHHKVPGISVAVIDKCRIVLARGYGVAEAGGKRVGPETRFQAASISKPVTAVAALRLVEQGRLPLDADLGTLRGWKLPASEFGKDKAVTLRGLLSHGAGLGVHGFRGYAEGEEVPTTAQILAGMAPANSGKVELVQAPGSAFRYSGGGYTVAQQAMVEAGGEDFPGLMRRLVLKPLAMRHSGFEQPLPPRLRPLAASGHRPDGSLVPGKWHTYPEMAAAGLWTTPSDLARFLIAVDAAARGKGKPILASATAGEMLRKQIGNWGLGLGLGGDGKSRRFGHGGANEGFRAETTFFPATCQGAAVMTNSDNGGPLMFEVMRALADRYGWPDPMPSTERTAVAVTAAMRDRFAGAYRLVDDANFTFTVAAAAGGGFAVIDSFGRKMDFLAESALRLFDPDNGMAVVAEPGEGAAPAIRIEFPGGGTAMASRIESIPEKSK